MSVVSQPRVISRRRRPGRPSAFVVTAFVGVALVVMVAGYLVTHKPSSAASQLVGDVSELGFTVLGTLACARAAWRQDAHSRGWFFLTLSFASWTLGQTFYTYYGITRNHVYPFPSLADAGYLGYAIPAVVALFAFPKPPALLISRFRAVLDILVIALGVLYLSLVTVLDPVMKAVGVGSLGGLVTLGYPTADMLIVAVVLALGMRQPASERLTWLFLGGGIATIAVTDSVYVRLLTEGHTALTGGGLAVGWLTGFLLVVLATLAPKRVKPRQVGHASLFLELIPYLPLLGVIMVMTLTNIPRPPFLRGVRALLLLCVVIRQLMIMFENVSLTEGLESRIAARTAELTTLGSIVTSSTDAIVGVSLDCVIISWNPAAERLYGYGADEVLGRRPTFLSAEHLLGLQKMIDTAKRGETVAGREIDWPSKTGETLPVALTTSPILNGAVKGISIFGQDVTERRRAAATLERAREEALESARLKSEFLATMSHEIRTPMNGVIGLTSLLLETSLTDAQRQYAEGVRGSGEALLTVINDILDFSKLEAGRVALDLADFDPRRLIDEVGSLLAPAAFVKPLELLAYCLPEVPARLHGDAGRIRQIVLNLASNAVKFTSAGEVSIKVRYTSADGRPGSLRFEVRDTGIGISEHDRGRLFESFAQADASTTREYGGTGLGLAISQRLVEAMDGQIGFTSTVGVGSMFWFEIPLALGDPTRPDSPVLSPNPLAGLRVVVVDDNATNRTILDSQLTSWGLKTDLVEDAWSALRRMRDMAARGESYDIAVLDMCMPGMDGLQLAQAVSTDPGLTKTRMIMLTSTFHLDVASLRQAGVSEWLTKPVRSSEFYDRLMRLAASDVTAVTLPRPATPVRPSGKSHRGRVLVVEDNMLNQLVAEGMVSSLGYQVDIVANGLEALNALLNVSYAAVLMDCQMPVMDGFEATREIRRRQGAQKRVPVIAMTAEAMPEDRDRCLAAGMDDYISKPIDQKVIESLLAAWVEHAPDDETSTIVETLDRHSAPPADPPIDAQRLDQLRELGSLGHSDVLTRIVGIFARDSPRSMTAIRKAVRSHAVPDLMEALHSLKGSSANIGAVRVADLCRRLETEDPGSATAQNAELLDQLERELDRANEALADAVPAG